MATQVEFCIECNNETGKAGVGNGSLYTERGDLGPYCDDCFPEYTRTSLTERTADYTDACVSIAKMHAAAVGEVTGPARGVIEDVEDLRSRCLQAEAKIAELNAGGYPAWAYLDGTCSCKQDPCICNDPMPPINEVHAAVCAEVVRLTGKNTSLHRSAKAAEDAHMQVRGRMLRRIASLEQLLSGAET